VGNKKGSVAELPFSISVDKNADYPDAFTSSQADKIIPHDWKLRRVKYLNNVIEQDHRRVKQRIYPMLGFKNFGSAAVTISGIELLQKLKKGSSTLQQ
jgi:transposase-like protein